MISKGVRRVLAIVDWLSLAGAVIAAVMMAIIALLILGEITVRIFRHTMPFAWEYGAYLNGAVFFLAAGYTIRTNGHIRVTLILGGLSVPKHRLMEIAVTILGLGISGLLSVSLTLFAYETYAGGVTSNTIMATPLIYPKAALAFGANLLTLQIAARLVRLVIGDPPDINWVEKFGI